MKNKFLKISYITIAIFIIISNIFTVCADDVDYDDFNQWEIEENITEEAVSNNVTERPSINSKRFVIYDRISKTIR